MPTQSHLIGITVHGIDNSPIPDVLVTLTGNGVISGTTDATGKVILNLGDLSSWSVGDVVSITAVKSGKGTKTTNLTITTQPQQIVMDLEEASDYLIFDDTTRYHALNFAVLSLFDGTIVTHSNPLPVKNVDENGMGTNRVFTQTMASVVGTSKTEYIGKAVPGTSKNEARWQIQKIVYSGNFISDIQWAEGSDAFDKIWDNRTSYNYS